MSYIMNTVCRVGRHVSDVVQSSCTCFQIKFWCHSIVLWIRYRITCSECRCTVVLIQLNALHSIVLETNDKCPVDKTRMSIADRLEGLKCTTTFLQVYFYHLVKYILAGFYMCCMCLHIFLYVSIFLVSSVCLLCSEF